MHEMISGEGLPNFGQRFTATFLTASIIGWLDTTLTHPFRNVRVKLAQNEKPRFFGIRDRLRFMTNAVICQRRLQSAKVLCNGERERMKSRDL